MSPPSYDALERLARRCGVEPRWVDYWGAEHRTSPRTAAGILAAMGIAAESPAAARRSLAAQEQRAWSRLLPEAIVVRRTSTPVRDGCRTSSPITAGIQYSKQSFSFE